MKTSKKQKLWEHLRKRRIFSTADVIAYGTRIYSNRADRYKREFQERGLIRRLKPKELRRLGKEKSMQAWYKVIKQTTVA